MVVEAGAVGVAIGPNVLADGSWDIVLPLAQIVSAGQVRRNTGHGTHDCTHEALDMLSPRSKALRQMVRVFVYTLVDCSESSRPPRWLRLLSSAEQP